MAAEKPIIRADDAETATAFMLARLFPRWRGDAAEPALPAPAPSRRPGPAAAARKLEVA